MSEIVIRASNLFRRALCHASGRAEAGVPEVESADSSMGTRLHRLLPRRGDPSRWEGVPYGDQVVVEKAEELRDRFVAWVEAELGIAGERFKEFYEVEVAVKFVGGHVPGHSDYVRYYPDSKVLLIDDAKFGTNEVQEAEVNLQLRTYFVGALEIWNDVRTVYVSISQPRKPFDEQFHAAVYDAEDREPCRAEIASIHRDNHRPDAAYTPSLIACRHCKAAPLCDAGRAFVSEAEVEIPRALDAWRLLSPDLKAEYYDKALLAASFCKSFIDRMKADVEADPAAWGAHFKLEPNAPIRTMPDVSAAFAFARSRYGDAFAASFIRACGLSVTELQEAASAVDPEIGSAKKKDQAKVFNRIFADLIEMKPKAASVKRIAPSTENTP